MATVKTKAGATVKITAASAAPIKGKGKGKAKQAASPLPTVATLPTLAPVAPLPVVALRSGPVVQAVTMGPKVYRVKAAHTLVAWQAVCGLMASGPAAMPAVLTAIKAHPSLGGAAGFVQYCLRRGYLVAA